MHVLFQRQLSAAALTMIVGAASFPVQAQQKFPARPLRIVVSTQPASQPDGLARFIAQRLSESWGVAVVVENRPAANGTLAASTVAKATPDGHTLLYALPNFVISTALQSSLPYDPVKDFRGVAHIGNSTNILVASPTLGVKTVKDFIALAQAQPGKLIFSSSATGSSSHLSGARFNNAAGIKVVHVAYRGGPESMLEVIAGRAHYHLGTTGVTLPFIKDGKLVALAVTSPQRSPALPDVPALAETHAEFKRPETSHSLLAPAGTPRAIVEQIGREALRIIESAEMKERMNNIGFVNGPAGPEETDRIVRAQISDIARIVRDAGLKGR